MVASGSPAQAGERSPDTIRYGQLQPPFLASSHMASPLPFARRRAPRMDGYLRAMAPAGDASAWPTHAAHTAAHSAHSIALALHCSSRPVLPSRAMQPSHTPRSGPSRQASRRVVLHPFMIPMRVMLPRHLYYPHSYCTHWQSTGKQQVGLSPAAFASIHIYPCMQASVHACMHPSVRPSTHELPLCAHWQLTVC